MHDALTQSIEECLRHSDGTQVAITGSKSLSGGCIHSVVLLNLSDDRSIVAKINTDATEMFRTESMGLVAIKATMTIRVPEVIGTGSTTDGQDYLLLEAIPEGSRSQKFSEEFGIQLAAMHRCSQGLEFGFNVDNFIGATPQPNDWSSSWTEFWATNRIEYQLKLAVDNGLADDELSKRCTRLVERLPEILGVDEAPALIHGDLWSGNFLVDANGLPVLIDPAAYHGSREAEFGMTTLFGGFNTRFYDAYNEAYPLQDDWQERVAIYRLYHLMNHLNLFGSSYLSGCKDILRRFS